LAKLGHEPEVHEPETERRVPPQADPDQDNRLAPTTGMMSSGLIVLANLLKRGVLLRYKRLAGFLP
jgi:hypothetical protein